MVQEPALDMLHLLRIDIKRLRYTLEYFKEVLGEEAKSVIRSAVQLQDHLGDLHDADVACQILIGFLDHWRVESQREQIDIRGITDYLVTKQLELRELVNTFPKQWEAFNSQMIRRDLALAVAHL
jgi:CHAD domain-containing protein